MFEHTIFNNTSALGLMPEDVQKSLKQWQHGHELYTMGGWKTIVEPSWLSSSVYRAKPAPPPTKPSINWSHVAEEYNWLARDRCGTPYLYKKEPRRIHEQWVACGEFAKEASNFASYQPGNCDWAMSLIYRFDKNLEEMM
jgi:hypothetical protein